MAFFRYPYRDKKQNNHSTDLTIRKDLTISLTHYVTEDIRDWNCEKVAISWEAETRTCRIEPGTANDWPLSKYKPKCGYIINTHNFFDSSSEEDWNRKSIKFTFDREHKRIEFIIPKEIKVPLPRNSKVFPIKKNKTA